MLNDGEKAAILQRDKATYAIAPHLPCGMVAPETLRKLADVAEKYGCATIKVTSQARIALVGLKEEDIDSAWGELGLSPGAAVGMCVRGVKACPGTTFCRLGQQDSLGVGLKLDEKYHGMELPSKLKIGVSGCMNQCAETCIKDLGLIGKKKGWVIMVGGCGGPKPHLAQELLAGLSTEEALVAIDAIIDFYRKNGKARERFWKTIERIGIDSLRAAVLPG